MMDNTEMGIGEEAKRALANLMMELIDKHTNTLVHRLEGGIVIISGIDDLYLITGNGMVFNCKVDRSIAERAVLVSLNTEELFQRLK